MRGAGGLNGGLFEFEAEGGTAAAFRAEAARAAETRILDTLTGLNAAQATQSSFREMLRKGVLDDRQIDVDVPHSQPPQQSGVIQLDQSNPVSINDF